MKKIIYLCVLSLSIMLMGCGKNKKLEEYNVAVSAFITAVSDITSTMENIDTASESAESELLGCLDSMQEEFRVFAELEVPSKFSGIESLADEASDYMNEAVALYHEVFEAEEFDESKAGAANENYSRAMQRLSYISSLLQGELPEGANITITEEDATDFTPIEE